MSRLLAPYRVPDVRRESRTAFVNGIRRDVDGWRAQGYPGVTETTRRLLTHWFETDHPQPYYFCQREAIETLVYLYEVRQLRRMSALAEAYNPDVAVRAREDRYARYVFKMATGSGKTKVMSLTMVWSYFNAVHHPEMGLPKTFLLIAPNVIVYERLLVDFEDGRIFRTDPLIPPEWRSQWQFSVITRDDPSRPTTPGVLFATNVHQLYDRDEDGDSDEPEAIAAVLGPNVKTDVTPGRQLWTRVAERGRVFVLNDEGHHLHNDDLKWKQIIDALHDETSGGGVAGQFDFTATPKHTDGKLFREVIVDYPIAQAVEDGIVKTPLIGELTGAEDYQSADASVRFRDRINAGIEKWRDFAAAMEDDPTKKPLLFIMAENTMAADQIADYLEALPAFWGRVLNIHTNARGEVVEGKTKAKKVEIERLRQDSRKVDSPDNPYAAIVSVLMLREGWDVRNVCVIVPLRPLTAKANILPEQTLGRGLRRMSPPASGDVQEQVVVIEHAAFKEFWKRELDEEGLQIQWVPVDKIRPNVKTVVVDPTRVDGYDIAIPVLTPLLVRSVAKLQLLSLADLEIGPMELPDGPLDEQKIGYTGRHMFTLEVVERAEFEKEFPVEPSGYISLLVRLIERETRLTGQFARLAPLVKEAIESRLFARAVSMDDEVVMRTLNRPEAKLELFGAFVAAINELSVETQTVALEQQWVRASATNPFTTTRRGLEGTRTVFNLVPVANNLEADFTAFLESEEADDVLAYFKNETAVHFEIEYQSVTGGIRKYVPDFVVRCADGCVYVVETKGQEDLEVERKDTRARRWCADATALTGQQWRFVKVPEEIFRAYPVKRFTDLVRALN